LQRLSKELEEGKIKDYNSRKRKKTQKSSKKKKTKITMDETDVTSKIQCTSIGQPDMILEQLLTVGHMDSLANTWGFARTMLMPVERRMKINVRSEDEMLQVNIVADLMPIPWAPEDWKKFLEHCLKLIGARGNLILFLDEDKVETVKSIIGKNTQWRDTARLLYWYRQISAEDATMSMEPCKDTSPILVCSRTLSDCNFKNSLMKNGRSNTIPCPLKAEEVVVVQDVTFRTSQKPVALIVELLLRYTANLSNSVVFDPTMGSGSTAVAALHLGLPFIGWDKDRACEDVVKSRVSYVFGSESMAKQLDAHAQSVRMLGFASSLSFKECAYSFANVEAEQPGHEEVESHEVSDEEEDLFGDAEDEDPIANREQLAEEDEDYIQESKSDDEDDQEMSPVSPRAANKKQSEASEEQEAEENIDLLVGSERPFTPDQEQDLTTKLQEIQRATENTSTSTNSSKNYNFRSRSTSMSSSVQSSPKKQVRASRSKTTSSVVSSPKKAAAHAKGLPTD
jgi:hypothetical protein